MTIALPTAFRLSAFTLWQHTNQRTFASPFGGSEQTLDMLQDCWMVSLSLPPRLSATRPRDRGVPERNAWTDPCPLPAPLQPPRAKRHDAGRSTCQVTLVGSTR